MTVQELIEALQQQNPTAVVVFKDVWNNDIQYLNNVQASEDNVVEVF